MSTMISSVIYHFSKPRQATRGREALLDSQEYRSSSPLAHTESASSHDLAVPTAPDVLSDSASREPSPSNETKNNINININNNNNTRPSRGKHIDPTAIPITTTTIHSKASPSINRSLKRAIEEDDHADRSSPIRHGSIEPPAKQKVDEKRILRSQDTKPTSELLAYFPWLDDEWVEARKKAEYITYVTPILVVDDKSSSQTTQDTSSTKNEATDKSPYRTKNQSNGTEDASSELSKVNNEAPFEESGKSGPKQYPEPQAFDFSSFVDAAKCITEDPMSDSRYIKPHRRAEILEKRLRNIERERLQHDKSRFEQYLERLTGPDWLKLLGVERLRFSDEERHGFEKKRKALMDEIEIILEKFKAWKDEEKRRKTDKDGTPRDNTEHQLRRPEKDDFDFDESSGEDTHMNKKKRARKSLNPNVNMVQQVRLVGKEPLHTPTPPPPPPKPFVSFYDKEYTRIAALNVSRRISRNTMAFGQPLPDVDEREFYLDEDVIQEQESRASKKRLKTEPISELH